MSSVLTLPSCDMSAFTEPVASLSASTTRRPKPVQVIAGPAVVPPRPMRDADGVAVLSYKCSPRSANILGPLPEMQLVRAVDFLVCRVHWRPNPEHPYYQTPCPRDVFGEEYPFAQANVHQIVLQLGGKAVSLQDEQRLLFEPGTYPSAVVVDVNDRVKYDNDGHYEVWVYRFYT
ncbi:MAG: hypothetical protein HZB16_03960 [Armatimonadetes bacterium]|nr:hypothetical protein [Armatimonadota bacterium]